MMHELESHDFHRASPIFADRKQYIPARSVLAGRFPGRVFVDRPDSPTVALVWALSRWAYIDGAAEGGASSLPELMEQEVFPTQRRLGHGWFELYTSSAPAWATTIEQALGPFQPERHTETTSLLDVARYRASGGWPALPDGHRLEAAEFYVVPESARDPELIAEVHRKRKTFGFRLMQGDRVVAVCRSTGFEADDEFMVDVKTPAEQDRVKGYATLVSRALIDCALEKGYSPLWECADDNTPSRRLARKLCFAASENYPVYAMRVPEPEG